MKSAHGTENETDTKDFIAQIKQCIEEGCVFVPFAGAGLSVPSGVPHVGQLRRYLTFCVLHAFGLKKDALGTEAGAIDLAAHELDWVKNAVPSAEDSRWNPRSDPWPEMVGSVGEQTNVTGTVRMDQVLSKTLELMENRRLELGVNPGILREAYGSLADWRTALSFLSRLTRDLERGDLIMAPPDTSVVDSFFRYLLRDCSPSLGHRMIQALANLWRSDVILTTNFDDLLEQAFTLAGEPLATFEVPLGAPLPPARLVLERRALVVMFQ